VVLEYVDVETAKQTGRTAFGEMVDYLKAHPAVRVMLVEKTDRLHHNLKDWGTVDELDVEIHFPKEGVVLSRESRSSEKFMHGIKVLMAKNYIDNLSEEARKGMQEKAEQSYMDEGVQILELAQNAQRLFEQQEPRQKRRLLNFVLSNCSWEDGEVVATFRQPFDLLAETTAIVARHSAGDTANSAKRENWLAFNHRTLASSAPTSSDRSNKLALFERHAHSASRRSDDQSTSPGAGRRR